MQPLLCASGTSRSQPCAVNHKQTPATQLQTNEWKLIHTIKSTFAVDEFGNNNAMVRVGKQGASGRH